MTKKKLFWVGLLLVFGLGLSAPGGFAQSVNYLLASTSTTPLRPNSNAEALSPIVLEYTGSSATSVTAGNFDVGSAFRVTLNAPIVGYSTINTLLGTTAQADFCMAGTTTWGPCTSLTVTTVGATELQLTNDTAAALTWTTPGTYFVIYGLRVATAGLPGSTPITATITAYTPAPYTDLWDFPSGTNNTSVTVGTVQPITALTSSPSPSSAEEYDIYSCLGFPSGGVTITTSATENWAGAWTSLLDEQAAAPFAPSAGDVVTNGSNVSVVIAGIPAGVTIVAQPPFNLYGGSETWGAVPAPYVSTTPNSTATFTFVILATNRPTTTTIEGAIFSFLVTSVGALTTVNNPPMTTSFELSPAPVGSDFYPAFTYPTLGIVEELPGSPYSIIVFLDCQTTLFFPYVTNYDAGPGAGPLGNWDTALEVANMSSVPTNSEYYIFGYTIPTNGACTFSLYNAGTAATAGTPVQATPITTFTTPVILSGGIWASMLSGLVPKFPSGYAFAVCDFLTGEGYAQIVDNANGLGNWQVMSSYLAPAFDPPSPTTIKKK